MSAGIHFILVGTTHPGNIGSAARAIRTMGFTRLRLAAPACRADDDVARTNAAHATAVVDEAEVFPDLAAAVGDCALAMAVTARERRLGVPALAPREAAAELRRVAARQPVAVVFGRERSGLTNDEAALCQRLVHIPADPEHASLNLAQAVQILAYELRQAGDAAPLAAATGELATGAHLEGLYEHFERLALESGYAEGEAFASLRLRLRRLFQRAGPEVAEVNLLRGLLGAAERHWRR